MRLRHRALYPLLNTVEQKDSLTSQKQQQGGKTRKVYALTKKGEELMDTYNDVHKEQLQIGDP